jgi:hypothetical protein
MKDRLKFNQTLCHKCIQMNVDKRTLCFVACSTESGELLR